MKFFAPTKLSENIRETPEGFLLCLGVPITRTGELTYGEGETPIEPDSDGQVLIYRDADDVFHMDTIASFEGKPITINHPEDFVDPDNWSYLAKGNLQNVRRGEGDEKDMLLADLLITDALAIQLVKNGLREVSCGYEAEYIEMTQGKGRQTKIIGNHLALVEKGRAGPTCAINDHIGKGTTMSKLAEKMKTLFSKAVDEAVKDEDMEKKDDKKDDKKSDSKDSNAYDELVQICKDLSAKIEAMGSKKEEKDEASESKKEDDKNQKDESSENKKEDEKESKDEEESSGEKSLEERLKALELAVSKLLDMEGSEENMDEDKEDEEESEDDDFEESSMVGDTASRAEILSPGIKASKDVKVKALKAAYGTKEGKEIINSLTGGKAPTFDSAEKVETLFIAASELLKVKRSGALSKTKQTGDMVFSDSENGFMTPEKQNEINAAHWAKK